MKQRPGLSLVAREKLRICLTSSELTPLAKTGGLADVAAALSTYLYRSGHEMVVLMPRYSQVDSLAQTIEPVADLQDLSMRIGPWDITYSIDTTTLADSTLPIYLLRCPALYDRAAIYTDDDDEHLRFVLLTRAAIELCQRLRFSPHIFHSHDWHTALTPLYLRTVYAWDTLFAKTKTVHTIHNIGYQGVFPAAVLPDLGVGDGAELLHQDDLSAGRINFMKTGVLHADLITTVSPTYAREIQGGEYGMGLDDLLRQRSDTVVGIQNGVDYGEWNPKTDVLIPARYSLEDLTGKAECKRQLMDELSLSSGQEQPLIGIVTRLVSQKGIELIESVVPRLLTQRNFSLAVLGSGESRYEHFFGELQLSFRDRVCYYRGYNNKLAHWIEAGADLFLMPSLYEPCGLNQMYSLIYGTVPIVRHTGGLADSVQQIDPDAATGTGILFRDYSDAGLEWAINTALNLHGNRVLWEKIIHNGMSKDFSWDHQGERYVELFRRLSDLS